MGNDVISHSGKVSILLGGDNYRWHPPVIKQDRWGVSLLRSKLSGRHIIYGPVNPSSITWSQALNVINVMSVSVVEFHEQEPICPISVSSHCAERSRNHSDPTNVESVETLNLVTRVPEIQEVQITEFSNTPIPNLNPEKDESIQHNLTPSREDGVTAPPDPTVTHKDVIINPPVPTINLRKTSIISRFQEQFTMFDSKILSKPDLKPPWNLYKRERRRPRRRGSSDWTRTSSPTPDKKTSQ